MLSLEPHKECRNLEDFCYDFWDKDGRLVRKQLSMSILFVSRGWATLFVSYRHIKHYKWDGPHYHLVRMRRAGGKWQKYRFLPLGKHHILPFLEVAQSIITESEAKHEEMGECWNDTKGSYAGMVKSEQA